MVLVDVPMYWNRYLIDQSKNRRYELFSEAFPKLFKCSSVNGKDEFWIKEMPWMSGYFSVAVWISIALAFVDL